VTKKAYGSQSTGYDNRRYGMHLAIKQISRHWGIKKINSLKYCIIKEPMTRDNSKENINITINISLNTVLTSVGNRLKYQALTTTSTHEIIERQ